MTLAIIFGLSLFTTLAIALFLVMGRSSAQGALLEEVTRQVRGGGPVPAAWRSVVSADSMAKPFAALRGLFASEPDPDVVRRLMLAGYRKPHHADIFLGARLALPAALGLTGTFQIASFHPAYQFAGTAADAVENYTNRSPYPMLHLLREESVTAVAGDPRELLEIPRRNRATLNSLGRAHLRERLRAIQGKEMS